MNKTKIEWTEWSWNPMTGCLHDCWYCYARRIAKRFYGNFKPKLFIDRLREDMPKKPSKIFVCSMADLFGEWVKSQWIKAILYRVRENPQHTFQFLTKNPERYLEFEFPKNCWLGTTITGAEQDILSQLKVEQLEKKNNYKFISFEPLLGSVEYLNLINMNLIIVGAMTGMGKKNVIPQKEWIDSIKHPNIYYKENIKKFL